MLFNKQDAQEAMKTLWDAPECEEPTWDPWNPEQYLPSKMEKVNHKKMVTDDVIYSVPAGATEALTEKAAKYNGGLDKLESMEVSLHFPATLTQFMNENGLNELETHKSTLKTLLDKLLTAELSAKDKEEFLKTYPNWTGLRRALGEIQSLSQEISNVDKTQRSSKLRDRTDKSMEVLEFLKLRLNHFDETEKAQMEAELSTFIEQLTKLQKEFTSKMRAETDRLHIRMREVETHQNQVEGQFSEWKTFRQSRDEQINKDLTKARQNRDESSTFQQQSLNDMVKAARNYKDAQRSHLFAVKEVAMLEKQKEKLQTDHTQLSRSFDECERNCTLSLEIIKDEIQIDQTMEKRIEDRFAIPRQEMEDLVKKVEYEVAADEDLADDLYSATFGALTVWGVDVLKKANIVKLRLKELEDDIDAAAEVYEDGGSKEEIDKDLAEQKKKMVQKGQLETHMLRILNDKVKLDEWRQLYDLRKPGNQIKVDDQPFLEDGKFRYNAPRMHNGQPNLYWVQRSDDVELVREDIFKIFFTFQHGQHHDDWVKRIRDLRKQGGAKLGKAAEEMGNATGQAGRPLDDRSKKAYLERDALLDNTGSAQCTTTAGSSSGISS